MPSAVRLSIHAPSVKFTYDKASLRKVMRAAGAEVAQASRAMLRQTAGSGRLYRGPGGSAAAYRGGYKAGAYRASAPGAAPVRVTGALAGSIKVRPYRSGEGVAIRDTQFYALFLQAGAQGGGRVKKSGRRVRGKAGIGTKRVLQPRPFLSLALASRKASLEKRIADSLTQDIAFVRVKP